MPYGATMNTMNNVPFGLRDVERPEKRALVGDVFAGVASRYDLMNDLMSAGLHRCWRQDLMRHLNRHETRHTLDLAGGTGDLAFRIRRRFAGARVVVVDASAEMIGVGRRRSLDRGLVGEPGWIGADAADLPFADRTFTQVLCAFGLRNFAELGRSLREVRRVLRPGGRFQALEFTPRARRFDSLYAGYLRRVLPRLGEAVTGRGDAYTYLAESIRRFLTAEAMADELEQAGFGTVRVKPYAGGVACLYSARRI